MQKMNRFLPHTIEMGPYIKRYSPIVSSLSKRLSNVENKRNLLLPITALSLSTLACNLNSFNLYYYAFHGCGVPFVGFILGYTFSGLFSSNQNSRMNEQENARYDIMQGIAGGIIGTVSAILIDMALFT